MSDNDWERVKVIVDGALEKDPSERELYLDEVCGDDLALRAEVSSLLRHEDAHFLEQAADSEPDLVARRISHYEIVEELSRGGMGIVYRARDLRLDREVAFKVLPGALLSSPERKSRFFREARAAAALKHPNVAHVYEIDENDGVFFIVMELIEGERLSDVLAHGPLAAERALDIAMDVAAGLQEIHDKGIVHRDVKPANILVGSDGRARIIDFGVAKLLDTLESEGDDIELPRPAASTETGQLMGTLSYMSPEQWHRRKLDSRSDVFSFGVVLFEMLTGTRPFDLPRSHEGSHPVVDEPLPLRKLPHRLAPVLQRCLTTDPECRYPTMASVLEALKAARPKHRSRARHLLPVALGGVAAIAAVAALSYDPAANTRDESSGALAARRIAVLPFDNQGGSGAYVAAGITDEIRARLSGVSAVVVIARESSLRYRGTAKSAREIGEELGADFLLGGTIRVQEDEDGIRVRVRPQLTRASDATQQWAAVYDETLTDPFRLESEIARRVVDALDINVLAADVLQIGKRPSDNLEAYEYYLRGNEHFNRGLDEANLSAAVRMYEMAVRLDPSFAVAHASLSQAHGLMYWFYDQTTERREKVEQAADTALDLDPNLPDAHIALGYYHYRVRLDAESALSEFGVAREMSPNNMWVWKGMGAVRRMQGLFEQSVDSWKAAAELNSRSPVIFLEIGATHYLERNYEEAERYYERAITLDPDGLRPYAWKAWLYLDWHGDTDTARATLQRSAHRAGAKDHVDFVVPSLVLLDSIEGKYGEAIERLMPVSRDTFETQFSVVPKDQLYGEIYGLMGETDRARQHYGASRDLLESRVASRPDDPRLRAALGIAYASLGRRADAIREGRRAIELLPMTKHAFRGAYLRRDLARIYAMTGELDAAVDELEHLVSISSPVAVPRLRLDPIWRVLGDHPRFQRLISTDADAS